jgi:hypothetical protein
MSPEELSDPTDIDWDAELAALPQVDIQIEIQMEAAERTARRLVEQWLEIRAGDALNFDSMPAEVGLDPDDRLGEFVVDQYTKAICTALDFKFEDLTDFQATCLDEAVVDCIAQGVNIGLGAVPDETIRTDETEEAK